jgi:hypothetical protein
VGPTLGAEAISQGLWSMVIATIVILIFMVVYYNNSGYIADISVLINVFFIIGVLASLGAALTLPGIDIIQYYSNALTDILFGEVFPDAGTFSIHIHCHFNIS